MIDDFVTKKYDNCPNCGAVVTSEKCPYCGTLFYDFAAIDIKKPFFIKFKKGSKIFRAKCKLSDLEINMSSERTRLYADNSCVDDVSYPVSTINLELLIQSDNGILAMIVDTDEISPDYKAW